jgi:DNA-binding LacI/PurR family transcriptional regulator
MTRFVNPPLSTVHVTAQEMGQAAADALIAAVDSGVAVSSIRIEAALRMRASTRKLDELLPLGER